MAEKNELKIAILSDMHVCDGQGGETTRPSFIDMSQPEGDTINHPVGALKDLANREDLSADILLCTGDMGHKADPKTISHSWGILNDLKTEFKAKHLIAVPGNHDHDSKSEHCEFDPKYHLQQMDPTFPYLDDLANSKFWAWHWGETVGDFWRIISLNSSAYHGLKEEFKHGRVSKVTIDRIKKHLSASPPKDINILVCHHHLQRNEEITLEDYQVMDGAAKLLSVLSDDIGGDWLIVHGHLHCAKILYSQGQTSDPPTIFSAGSFSAVATDEYTTITQNQFYIITLKTGLFDDYNLVGSFRSWDWAAGRGWVGAGQNSGLPAFGGFGYRRSPTGIALKIADLIKSRGVVLRKEDVHTEFPELQYIAPGDMNRIQEILKNTHNIAADIMSGRIEELGEIRS